MDLKQFKVTFDGILQTYVDEKIGKAKKLLNNEKLNKFIEYIDTFIFSGGKRIRPYCLWLTYMGLGGKKEKEILNLGIVFELLHSMALIHDDIIDQAEKRHNAPTVHYYIDGILGHKSMHIAEGQAILIGDLLLSRVYEYRYKNMDFETEVLYAARQNVHEMIEEVILGQIIDVDMMATGETNPEMINKKNMYKTASYTFTRPMLTGAILAKASDKEIALIKELGDNLGMAFQVRDDLFDITFADKTKSQFSDIQEGQQTYFTHYIMTKGSPEYQELLKSCMGRKLDDQEIAKLQDMFTQSGAIEFGKGLIKDFSEKAKKALQELTFSDEIAKQGLEVLIKKISELSV